MRYYLYVNNSVVGPYEAEDIRSLFGGLSPVAVACPEDAYSPGNPGWLNVTEFPELAACVKLEIAEPLPLRQGVPAARRPLEILSTDDEPSIRALLWHMLSDAGHSVAFAKDGEEVFKRLAAKTYDLLILDVNMPKMHGYKVSELVHEKMTRPPKVIIFTGRDLEKERLQFVCSGADAILNKGTGNDKLLETIEELFNPEAAAKSAAGPAFPSTDAAKIRAATESFVLQEKGLFEAVVLEKPAIAANNTDKPAVLAAVPPAAETRPGLALPAGGPPVRDAETSAFLVQSMPEAAVLAAEMREIKKFLVKIVAQYSQLEEQLENYTLNIAAENKTAAKNLEAELEKLRTCAGLTALLLLLVLLADILSR